MTSGIFDALADMETIVADYRASVDEPEEVKIDGVTWRKITLYTTPMGTVRLKGVTKRKKRK